ncbi:MAG: TRAP transporter TatT component family protein [Methylicorpusculum sp.]|uniref:tetratricopeptide repeat protein n=2 Tax=Methylicorpusculum sp. TaxID=2713644 RepID=UPI00271A023E|nr:TRAP transporter TatT component family protein [Methylicorpusculum sp.]MDO8939941.1 TRAP transporter TatT component family protein [Methylicorpusculum sp.]MDO9241617.1 TRAP transporter TatT component family protein [Methylicorpusculum sp.]MDP2201327.1 TRAP transporter TatT component family protein [Methylicorpusculum sp.]
MKIVIFVAFALLSNAAQSNSLSAQIDFLEGEWAKIYYSPASSNKAARYNNLLHKARTLKQENKNASELLFWEAVLISSAAEHSDPLNALNSIEKARKLLLKAIEIDPKTMQGSAYVTLGSLYYQAPGWPISFGDKNKAELFLKKALEINSNSIDANYFYADYLISENKPIKAIEYLKKTIHLPIRQNQSFADNQLKAIALKTIKTITDDRNNLPKNAWANLTTSFPLSE